MNMKNKKLNNLKKLVSKTNSSWIEKAKTRKENRFWSYMSQQIALRTLEELSNRQMSQVALAEKLNVEPQQINRILKGNENLTLKTIGQLQLALGIRLITVNYDISSDEGYLPVQAKSSDWSINDNSESPYLKLVA
jgi:plasmid maintenance system antidote protein VapI